MHRPKVNTMFRGTFDHDAFEHVCAELGKLGDVYSSMCSVESATTIAMASLHTCSSVEDVEAVMRAVLGESATELTVSRENANAEACL